MTIVLRDYQDAGCNELRAAYAAGKRTPLLVLPTGGGKCLAKGTPVMLYGGEVVPVEEVKIGDILMGPDSRPRRVVSLARGSEQMYLVTPSKGEAYTVNESHILSLKRTAERSSPRYPCDRKAGEIVNISVGEYMAKSKSWRHIHKGWRAAIDFPCSEPLQFDPYMLGAWLGDGSSAGYSITCGDAEIAQSFVNHVHSIGMEIRAASNSEGSVNVFAVGKVGRRIYGRGGSPANNALRSIGVLNNKHIPHAYKTASAKDRLAILAGIIDTDGYYTGSGYDLALKSERLIDDVIFVARSLGMSAYKSASKKTCTNTGVTGAYWRCSISGDVDRIPCRIDRKKARPRRQKKDVLMVGITVEPVGVGDYYGFELSGPDKLFLLGDFTVTHNTTIFSYVTASASSRGRCVWLIAHRAELVKQIAMTLARFGVKHRIIAPGPIIRQVQVEQFRAFGRSFVDATARVLVCSVQTVVKRLDAGLPEPDLIVCDEAHHLIADSSWGRVVSAYPDAKILPVTATPCRLDGKGLGVDHGGFADALIMGPTMRELIESGYLSPYRIFAPPNALDLTGVRTRMGDYAKDQLSAAVDKPKITGDAVEHYKRLAAGKRAVAFCVSVAHAEHVAQEFSASGVPAEVLDGSLDAMERDRRIKRFESGETLVLASCDVVSEGFDLPAIEVAILLRPTQSLALYLQQVGRALRIFPGKEYAIILDHVGAIATHGLPDEEREWSLEGVKPRAKKASQDEGGEESIQTCPKCYTVHRPAPECPTCAYVYPIKARKIEEQSGELVEITPEDLDRIRRQKRALQGSAQTVEELMAKTGMKRTQAEKIIQARADKAALIAAVLDDIEAVRRATGCGPWQAFGVTLGDVRSMKPKALKELKARTAESVKKITESA